MEGAEDGAVVEVRVAAKGLSCRDACVRLRVKPPGKEWELFAQTEVVPNEPSPSFMHGFRLPYVFGEIQHVRFEVTEGAATLGSEGHVLGTVTTTLADLVAAGGKVTRDLGKGASLKLFAEEVVRSDAFCSLFISCANLDKKARKKKQMSRERELTILTIGFVWKSGPVFRAESTGRRHRVLSRLQERSAPQDPRSRI